jgi:hypothetical protein
MKIKSAFQLSLLLLAFTAVLFSCTEKTSEPVQPDYPQLVGTWQGTTSQSQPIEIGIMNLNGLLVVNTYKYDVIKYDSGGSSHRTKHYEMSSSTVITSVVDKYFKFTPYDPLGTTDYLKGTFNDTTMILTGQFSSTFAKLTGTGYDVVTGGYTATKVK